MRWGMKVCTVGGVVVRIHDIVEKDKAREFFDSQAQYD